MSIRECVQVEVLSWEGVTSAPGRFGAVAFYLGKREIGHSTAIASLISLSRRQCVTSS
jgi:Family of unknown function (DUF5519)